MIAATDQPATRLCCACFDGSYPIELPGETQLGKNVVEHMLATAARTGVPIQEPEGRRHPVQADNDNVSACVGLGGRGSASRRRHRRARAREASVCTGRPAYQNTRPNNPRG